MIQASVAIHENPPVQRPVHDREIREVELRAPEDLPLVDLAELYVGIESALHPDHCLVLQLISDAPGAGCAHIALDLAWASACMLGKRVLLLNCMPQNPPLSRNSAQERDASENSSAESAFETRLVKAAGQEIYMAEVRREPHEAGVARAVEEVNSYFDRFCTLLDMIMVVAPPAQNDPLGTVMARHVDGNVIIVEANRSRRSSAIRLREVLLRSGRPIVGAILNDRQNYLPRWMTRMM